jgi:hypothetical protein
MPPQPNRRQYTRRATYIIAKYTVKEGEFRDIVKSIGANGLFIGTRRNIAIDQPIVLAFPLFDFNHQIRVQGNVVRSGPNGFAVEFEAPIAGLICKPGQFPDIVHEIDRS